MKWFGWILGAAAAAVICYEIPINGPIVAVVSFVCSGFGLLLGMIADHR